MPRFKLSRTVIMFICFIIVVAAAVFWIWPKYQEFHIIQSDIKKTKAEIKQQIDYRTELYNAYDKLKRHEKDITQIDYALPQEVSIPSLFKYFKNITFQYGLSLNSLSSAGGSSSGGGASIQNVNINLSVSGSYSSFKNFISALEESGRIFEIQSISFFSGRDGGLFFFNLSLNTHSY